MKNLGYHIILEMYDCDIDILKSRDKIEEFMLFAAKKSGATIIQSAFHQFNPFGVSGVVIIAESHLAIHTYPEFGYAAVDIFTCGETVDIFTATQYLKEKLGAQIIKRFELKRGLIFDDNIVSKVNDIRLKKLDDDENEDKNEI